MKSYDNNKLTFGGICEMIKPANIYLQKNYFGRKYIQEFVYNKELDIYKKSRRIKAISSNSLYDMRMYALEKANILK